MNLRQTNFVCTDHLDFELWQKQYFLSVQGRFGKRDTELSEMLVRSDQTLVRCDIIQSESMTGGCGLYYLSLTAVKMSKIKIL